MAPVLTPRVVYLDQNQWIELARAHYGKRSNPAQRLAADTILAAAYEGRILLPLSFGHYMETGSRRDESSRFKLGRLQYEASRDWRIAEYGLIARHEIEVALDLVFPDRVTIRPLQFLGHGVAHVFDKPATIRIASPLRELADPERVRALEDQAQREFEESLLTGYAPSLRARTPWVPAPATYAENFMNYLATFRTNLRSLDPATRERAIYATSLIDELDAVNEVLHAQRISADEFEALGTDGFNRFLHAQPTRRVDMHLRRLWVANQDLIPKRGDLNDWAFLTVASMYCDVLVTEKQFADLVRRPGLTTRAAVLTELEQLAAMLRTEPVAA